VTAQIVASWHNGVGVSSSWHTVTVDDITSYEIPFAYGDILQEQDRLQTGAEILKTFDEYIEQNRDID